MGAGADEDAVAGLRIDEVDGSVRVDGRVVKLTATELALLRVLVAAHGAPVSRQQLLYEVWHTSWAGEKSRAVDVHVSGLRRKLGDQARNPRWIETVRGVGFRALVSGERWAQRAREHGARREEGFTSGA